MKGEAVYPAKKYRPPQSRPSNISHGVSGSPPVLTEEEIDLGWKTPEEIPSAAKRRKGSKKADTITTAFTEENESARRIASMVSLSLLILIICVALFTILTTPDAIISFSIADSQKSAPQRASGSIGARLIAKRCTFGDQKSTPTNAERVKEAH